MGLAIKVIIFGLAFLGAVLAVLNTWRDFYRDQLKIKVTSKNAIPVGGASEKICFCVDVKNLSAFLVTVCDVGFYYVGTEKRKTGKLRTARNEL